MMIDEAFWGEIDSNDRIYETKEECLEMVCPYENPKSVRIGRYSRVKAPPLTSEYVIDILSDYYFDYVHDDYDFGDGARSNCVDTINRFVKEFNDDFESDMFIRADKSFEEWEYRGALEDPYDDDNWVKIGGWER